MKSIIDPTDERPIYQQIARQPRRSVAKGPCISTIAVEKVRWELERQSLIVAMAGKGRFVRYIKAIEPGSKRTAAAPEKRKEK